ncbi:MAG TPA: pentapeptide repeat-containing protein, partial [Methylomirabilota bacterium]|nr:pentapeptide repeat-containing protein [Methylomirabilota bacterium]
RVLPRLDGERKRNVIQFLHESGLINKNTPIIDLHEADLREASLDDAELKDANLSGAKLMKANLEGAKLNGAYLREADLREADLRGAQMNNKTDLSGAILKGANYNTNRMQGMNAQGIPLTLEPTQWPQGFDYKSTGAISVDS